MASGTATYYFNSYDTGEAFVTTPANMVDDNTGNYANTALNGDIQLLTGNTCLGTYLGKITAVELRMFHYDSGVGHFDIRPVFSGTDDGADYQVAGQASGDWSSYHDITNDGDAPSTWTWNDIVSLDCDIAVTRTTGIWYCSKVEIKVTYDADYIEFNNNDTYNYLMMPSGMVEAVSKSVENLVFNDGTDVQLSRGKLSDSLTLVGQETSSASATMYNLGVMMDDQMIVTVSGLPDTNLNTDYHIISLSFSQDAGMIDRYKYNIVLERMYDRLR